jgi:hypothetical protein
VVTPVYIFITDVYEQAVDNLLGQPHLPELAKYRLTSTEWDVLQDFEVILSVSLPIIRTCSY